MIIQNNLGVRVSHAGPVESDDPKEDGKFIGWITMPKEDMYRPLLNTEPRFETAAAAEKHMTDLVEEVRATKDL